MADLCKRGLHEDVPENELWADGRRRCRSCRNAYKRAHYQPRPSRDVKGERNPNWKGDAASYNAMHKRVVSQRGRASSCARCGLDDPGRWYDWANLTGRLNDPDDYEQMCRSCHRRFDYAR